MLLRVYTLEQGREGSNPSRIKKCRGWKVNGGDDLEGMKPLTCWSSPQHSPKRPPFPDTQTHTLPFAKKLCVLGATALGSLYK